MSGFSHDGGVGREAKNAFVLLRAHVCELVYCKGLIIFVALLAVEAEDGLIVANELSLSLLVSLGIGVVLIVHVAVILELLVHGGVLLVSDLLLTKEFLEVNGIRWSFPCKSDVS